MSCLNLYLLGSPRIERDGEPVKVGTRKAIALLAYIAITRERHGRDALVSLLWPEYDQTRGRTALRSTLYALRRALDASSTPAAGQTRWLDVDRESVGLNPRADISLDVDRFRGFLTQCHTHGHPPSDVCPACLSPLTDAVTLYRDDFMSGFSLRDSLNFDDWQFYQADALRRAFASALERLVRCHIAQGTFEPAIRYARRWLVLGGMRQDPRKPVEHIPTGGDHRTLPGYPGWSGSKTTSGSSLVSRRAKRAWHSSDCCE